MKKMYKETVVQWMLDKIIEHNGILQIKDIEKAMAMHNEQLSAAYTEGFKRCKYIRELSTGVIPDASEPTPDDFETYYDKTYGE
jgi:hypothetical protein